MNMRNMNQARFNRAVGITREHAIEQAKDNGTLTSKAMLDSCGRRVKGKYSKPTFIGGLIR